MGGVLGDAIGGRLPGEALVVRGGGCTADRFLAGAERIDVSGLLHGVSVNSRSGLSIQEAAFGVRNGQIGITTVSAIRAAGGEVEPDPLPGNPNHALLSGLTAEQAEALFTPTIRNPNR